jgi:hypothetical protein
MDPELITWRGIHHVAENGMPSLESGPLGPPELLPGEMWEPVGPCESTLREPVVLHKWTAASDRAVTEFVRTRLEGGDRIPGSLLPNLHLFRYSDLGVTRRTWTLHRRTCGPGASVVSAFDRATVLVLLPMSYSAHEGGQLVLGPDVSARHVSAGGTDAILVLLPAGSPSFRFDVTAGTQYWLSSPLEPLPAPLLAVMHPSAPSVAPRRNNSATIHELNLALDRIRREMDALRAEEFRIGSQLRSAMERVEITRTLIRVGSRSPPFVVILRDRYQGADRMGTLASPPVLRGDDAMTFVGLTDRYPGCRIHLLNVAVHLDSSESESDPEIWESAITESSGWIGPEAARATSLVGAALMLRHLPCVYGGDEFPGVIESTVRLSYDVEVSNVCWTVVLVAGP